MPGHETGTPGRQHTVVPTAVDAFGDERIVGPPVTDWKPAPVEPDPDEVARLEGVVEAEKTARLSRLGLLDSDGSLPTVVQ